MNVREGHSSVPVSWTEDLNGAQGPEEDVCRLAAYLSRRTTSEAAERVAKALLDRFGDLESVFAARPEAIGTVQGVSAACARDLRLVQQLLRRIARNEAYRPGRYKRRIVSSWSALIAYLRTDMDRCDREYFRVLFLDKKNQLILDEVMCRGTVDHAMVYPREVVRRALELSATAVILVHNHPSGDPTPSATDVDVTLQIIAAGRLLNIVVHDHLVIGGGYAASLKALGFI